MTDLAAPWRHDPAFGGMSDAAAKASWEATMARRAADPKPTKPRIKFARTRTNSIMNTKFPPLRAVVPGYLYEGFTVLAGRQKLGKTWLAIDWAVAVATGGVAMGSIDCEPGNVLYIDMENGPRRIQGRIRTLFPYDQALPDLSRLEWVTEAPQLDAGFIDELELWRRSVQNPTMVVIDVLQRIKPADTTIVLDSDQNGKTLYVRGRDVEEKETAIIFTAGNWTIRGEAADVRRTDERSQILSVLLTADEPMNPKEISIATRSARNSTDQLLYKMAKAGEVEKTGRGLYIHPDRLDLRKIDKRIRSTAGEAEGNSDD